MEEPRKMASPMSDGFVLKPLTQAQQTEEDVQ